VLVCGGSVDRTSLAGLAALLEPNFTVFNYDRHGRGPSGDTPPYAVQSEVEDIGAVIAAAGGSAFLFGSSSGAALALVAAASGLPVTKDYEAPFRFTGTIDHVVIDVSGAPFHDAAAELRIAMAEQ